MAIISNFVEQLRITLKQTFKLNIMESKNEALLRVTISTYFSTGRYRNNVVEIPLPIEAIKAINENINEMSRNSVSKYLAKNQSADFAVILNGQCIGGISNMCSAETQDEMWEIEKDVEEIW